MVNTDSGSDHRRSGLFDRLRLNNGWDVVIVLLAASIVGTGGSAGLDLLTGRLSNQRPDPHTATQDRLAMDGFEQRFDTKLSAMKRDFDSDIADVKREQKCLIKANRRNIRSVHAALERLEKEEPMRLRDLWKKEDCG